MLEEIYNMNIQYIKDMDIKDAVDELNGFASRVVRQRAFKRQWQKPSYTLEHGGDSIDIAIMKMDMLTWAGFSPDLFYLGISNKRGALMFHVKKTLLWYKSDVLWFADSIVNESFQAKKNNFYLTEEPYYWQDVEKIIAIKK